MKRLGWILLLMSLTDWGAAQTPVQMDLITDTPWPDHLTRFCTIDGKYNEAHCFPSELVSRQGQDFYHYDAEVVLEPSVRFDKDQWAPAWCTLAHDKARCWNIRDH